MQCERCNKKKATVFYRENVGGRVKALRLCGECADVLEQAGELEDMGTAISGFLSPFFLWEDGSVLLPFPSVSTGTVRGGVRKCRGCGATLGEIASAGRVGCAECYAAFSEELSEAVRSVHGNVGHTGRVSAGYRARRELLERVAALKKQLKEAVTSENYEAAVGLRDEIRALEARM